MKRLLTRSLLAAALFSLGCSKTNTCKSGTLLVTLTFDAQTSSADQVEVDVTRAGVGSTMNPALMHPSGSSSGTVEVDFPNYHAGDSVTVTAVALKQGVPIATSSKSVTLLPGCSTVTIDLMATDGGGAGTAGAGGNAGAAGGRGGSGGGGATGAGGSSTDSGSGFDMAPTCNPVCSGATPFCQNLACVACLGTSAPQCENNAPTSCVNGQWVSGAACGGSTPICTNGVCASTQVIGGIVTTTAPAGTTTVNLINGGFEFAPTQCGSVNGQTMCVIGGIRP